MNSTRRALAGDTLESVLGPISADELRWVHAHEHLCADFAQREGRRLDAFPGNLEYVRRALKRMLGELPQYGVNGLVDPMPLGVGRDEVYVRLAQEVSQTSGVSIFLATGIYLPGHWPEWVTAATAEELASHFVREAEEGIEGTGVKPALIKVAAKSLGPDEEKALTAAALAHRRTGQHHHCHVTNNRRPIVELLTGLGIPGRCIYLAHADMNTSEEEWLWLVEQGVGLVMTNWDYPYHMDQAEALRLTRLLLTRGYQDRLLIGLDFGMEIIDRSRTAIWTWDNPDRTSYSYLHTGVLPKLRAAGVTEEDLEWMMHRNPVEMLRRG